MENAFKTLRKKAELKQVDVSIQLNIVQSTVSMWETGESLPRADMLPKIAKLYKCTIDDLLNDHKEAAS